MPTRAPIVHVLGADDPADAWRIRPVLDRLTGDGRLVVVAGPPDVVDQAVAESGEAIEEGWLRCVDLQVPGLADPVRRPGRLRGPSRSLRLIAAGSTVVHAHGVDAGVLAAAARPRTEPGGTRARLVVTWTAPAEGGDQARRWWSPTSAAIAARRRSVIARAAVILASASSTVDELRAAGGSDVRLVRPPTIGDPEDFASHLIALYGELDGQPADRHTS